MSIRTKIYLGFSLCLSAAMIIVVITRASGMKVRGSSTFDTVWEVHWQWIECCIAITMVSLTAFRSFFIQHSTRNQSPRERPWYGGMKAAATSKKSNEENGTIHEWVQMPGGKISGIRSFISGQGREHTDAHLSGTAVKGEDFFPLQDQEPHAIRVQHDFSTQYEPASCASSGSLGSKKACQVPHLSEAPREEHRSFV